MTNVLNMKFSVIVQQDENGMYVGSVPALKGCHTQGKSLAELKVNLKEAIQLCLDVQEPDSSFIGVQEIEI